MAICTRNRPDHVLRALDALDRQSLGDFEVLVVDQSDDPDPELDRRQAADDRLRVIRDPGRGLSRSRNLAARALSRPWVAFVDDDCLPEPDWVEQLVRAIESHPEVDFISGEVGVANMPTDRDHLPAAVHAVPEARLWSGRWTDPQKIGFGVCMAVRRSVVEGLGGWDERLGPGVDDFPAADDMDFNYRLLRSGGVALDTPLVRARHDQWRTEEETIRVWRGYAAAWGGFAMKNVRTGNVAGGLWLWSIGGRVVARMFASSVRHRSRMRLTVALNQTAGLAVGTVKGLRRAW